MLRCSFFTLALLLLLAIPRVSAQCPQIRQLDRGIQGGWFGYDLSVDGDRMLVGAPEAGNGGRAFLYEWDEVSGQWTEVWTFDNPSVDPNAMFGWSVVLVGDRAFFGAPRQGGFKGTAHAFRCDGAGVWCHEDELSILADPNDDYGHDIVALSETEVVIAAPGRGGTGALYHFRYRNAISGWQQVNKISPTTPTVGGRFGQVLALDGDHLLVGSPLAERGGLRTGMANLLEFDASMDRWNALGDCAPQNLAHGDGYGAGAALDSGRAYVGATGSRKVFVLDAADCSLLETLHQDTSSFGRTLCARGDLLVVGTPNASLGGIGQSGGGYFFRHRDGVWSPDLEYFPHLGQGAGMMGTSCALWRERVLFGAPEPQNGQVRGVVYFYGADQVNLDLEPRCGSAGGNLSATMFHGPEHDLCVLFMILFDGMPATQTLGGLQQYGDSCQRTLSGSVPASLAGHTATFLAFEIGVFGKVQASAPTSVKF